MTLQLDALKLGPAQRRHIDWLTARFGSAEVLQHGRAARDASRVIVVAEAPKPVTVDALLEGLGGRIIVMPFGEDPAFDFLKSKLIPSGVISASGVEGPHQMWWGSVGEPGYPESPGPAPLIATSHPYWFDEQGVTAWRTAAHRLGLDSRVDYANGTSPFDTIESITRLWRSADRALLWLEARIHLRRVPTLLAGLPCDVAYARGPDGRARPDLLYLARTPSAEALLETWHTLAADFAGLPAGLLFDVAWALVAASRPLSTVWLPQSYDVTRGDVADSVVAATGALESDEDTPAVLADPRTARSAGRIAAPAPHLIVNTGVQSDRTATVLLGADPFGEPSTIASRIETIGAAIATDCGGFGRIDVVICDGHDDFIRTLSAVEQAGSTAIVIGPGTRISGTLFSRVAADDTPPFVPDPTAAAACPPLQRVAPAVPSWA